MSTAAKAGLAAARIGDPIKHSKALLGFLVGAAVGLAVGVGAAVFTIATFGAGALVIAAAVGGAVAATGGTAILGGDIGGTIPGDVTGKTFTGASTVKINSIPANRAVADNVLCSKHAVKIKPIAQGSGSVFIEGYPAARKGDKAKCSAIISEGSPNVFFGSEPVTYLELEGEIPDWMMKTAEWMVKIGTAVALGAGAAAAFVAGGICAVVQFGGTVALGMAGGYVGAEVGGSIGYAIGGERGRIIGGAIGGFAGGVVGGRFGYRTASGHPVDVVTGEMFTIHDDFTLPGPIPLHWQRTWISSSTVCSELGSGWSHPYDQVIIELDGEFEGLLSVRVEEGRLIIFPKPSAEKPSFDRSNQYLLQRVGDYYVLDHADGLRYEFSHNVISEHDEYWLSRIVDVKGNVVKFGRSSNGLLQTIIDSTGRVLQLRSNGNGRQIDSIWLYDRSDTCAQDHGICLVSYQYNADTDGNVLLASVADADGHQEYYAYNSTLIVQETQKDGFNYYFEWDDLTHPRKARCLKTWGGDESVPHYYREFVYEPEFNLCHATDGRGTTETCVGNAHGFVDKIINPNGDETSFGYDDDGLLVSRLDAVGETVFEYDHFGRLIIEMAPDQSETLYMYTHKGLQPTHVDYGAVQAVHTADGAQHRYQRDTHDEISEYTDPENRKVRFIRDATTGLLQATRDAQGQGARLYWDEFQQLSAIEYPQGGREHFQYDLKGRVVEYRKDDLITQYRYNGNDQCISAKRSDGVYQSWSYTPAGHLASHTRADGSTVQWLYHGGVVYRRINPDGTQFDYQYDTDHNLVGLINERGETYRLEYDENERLVKEVGFDGRTQAYHYNELGQLSQWIDQDRTVDLKRDKLNRVIQATYQQPDNEQGQTSEKQQVQFAYDPLGRLVKAQNEQRTLQYRYNLAGDLLEEHQDGHLIKHSYNEAGLKAATELPDGRTVSFEWDKHHQINRILLDDQLITQHQYDRWGREHQRRCGSLTQLNEYDPQDRLIKQQAYKAAHDLKHMVTASRKYTYNAMNQLIRQEDIQRGVQQYHYSSRQQLTGWQADFTNTQTIESGQYQFDPASQLIGLEEQQTDKRRIDLDQEVDTQQGVVSAGRLLVQGDKRYAYDQRGNRIHQWRGKDHAIQTLYRYSAQNELTEVVEQKRHIQTQVQFQYDALGRRIQKEVTQRSVRTGEITSHYKHDYLWMGDVILEDRCTELLVNSHPAKQAASDNKVVSIGANNNADTGELTSNAGVILYLHEPSAFRPLAQIRSEQTGEGEQTESIYYYHLDHIGTPLELTDEQGRIVWQANYTGFGQARIINSGITNLIRYPGQYEDSEIGLHYNRFRYYDPSSGQYTQQDPIGLMGGEQLSQYVVDPVNWVDVLGLQGGCASNTTRVRHYTNRKGSKAIEQEGVIKAKDNNRVYVEPANKKPLGQVEAENKYQIGRGRGRDYIETDVPTDRLEWVNNPRYGTPELTVKGDVNLENAKVTRRR